MKQKLILLLICICSFQHYCHSENVIEIEGIYQGENLFVMNPFASVGVGFCIFEVTVNGEITTDEIGSSAFEIDLSIYGFEIGDKIKVEIKHKDGCTPKVLNPEVLQPRSSYEIAEISVDQLGIVKWATTGERGELPFIVEQFKWNKWVKVETVDGKGTSGTNSYAAKVYFTSGLNKFRIKQTDYTGTPRYSEELTYNNLSPAVTYEPGEGKKISSEIIFSDITSYEIYNYYGELKLKGRSNKVGISTLESGMYFLNYDNNTASFEKK